MELPKVKAAKGFAYSTAPQRSPEWVNLRVGKVTASQLGAWMAVSTTGKPLASRAAYEKELAFEKAFNVPFSRFVTSAMEEGTRAESFLQKETARVRGYEILPSGAFYSDTFVASPDGLVGEDGLVEFKWLYDTKFAAVLAKGVSKEHYLQIQGQLWASGRQWCDYAAGSSNASAFKIVRVERDDETIKLIEEAVAELPELPAIDKSDVYSFTTKPDVAEEVSW